MYKILSFLVAMVLLSACAKVDVNVDYDESYKFSEANNFTILTHNKTSDNTLFNDRVIKALKNDLKQKGYQEVGESSADLIFVFHSNVKDKSQIFTDYQTMGYSGYNYGRFGSTNIVSRTSTYNYQEGTLVIDALNPKTKKIVWRSIGKKELDQDTSPQEKTAFVNKAIQNMMKEFPKK